MKRWIAVVLAVALLIGAAALAEEQRGGRGMRGGDGRQGGGPNGGGRGGNVDKSGDAELQAMLAEAQEKYQLLTFTDPDTGDALQYWLFVPEGYDASGSYPLLQFIPDSSVVGGDASAVLTQGWGGVVWATEVEQAKHSCFVVVPVFTETVVDDSFNTSGQIETAVKLIRALMEEYAIDPDRVYTTGQSMGGMTSFHLNVTYPDLFAASLYVSSQWNTEILGALEDDNFFYIVSAGDPKASAGQAALIQLFDADGAAYSRAEWSARDDAAARNAAVAAMLAEGNACNFVTFAEGTTLAEGQAAGGGAGEHMTSFDYAYKLEAVRDWLFAQVKA